MLRPSQLRCSLLCAQLLTLPLLHAVPVSSPEIANKSPKMPNSILAQQQQQLKAINGQDTQLNSLSAFASGYDSLPTAQAQIQAQSQSQPPQPQPSAETGFKPSYKLPEMETNFTPMQQNAGINLGIGADGPNIASLPSTPMLMQYLPAQQLQDGSGTVQYLQLIPTRPIIVPISPFLAAAAANAGMQAPPPQLASNGVAAAAAGGATVQLSGLPANTGVTGLHYSGAGLQGYANAIAPMAAYRSSYRINREAKQDKHYPAAFSLNLNEYLPGAAGGHDAAAHPQHTQVFIRAARS